MKSKINCNVSAYFIWNKFWNSHRICFCKAHFLKTKNISFSFFKTSNSNSQNNTCFIQYSLVSHQTRIFQSHFCSSYTKLSKASHLAGIL